MISMIRTSLVASMLTAAIAGTCVCRPALTVSAASHRTKQIHFVVRNESSETAQLQIGSDVKTLASSQSLAVALPDGSIVTAVSAFATYAKGETLVHVQKELDGKTVIFH